MPGSLPWLPRLADADAARTPLRRYPDPAERLRAILHAAGHQLDFLQTTALERALQKTVAELGSDARALGAFGLAPLKVALLASSTVDHLVPATVIAGLRRGLYVTPYVGPYNQYRQELLDEASELGRFAPEAVILSLDPGEAIPALPLAVSEAAARDAIEARIDGLRRLWAAAKRRFRAIVVQQTVPDVAPPIFGSFDRLVPASPASLTLAFNQMLARAAAEDGVLLLDLDAASASAGRDAWFDPVRWHHAKQLVAPAMAAAWGDRAARVLAAARGLAKKCLVLDLDNTLWGGVVGDDGVENLVLGQGSAAGEAYLAFQRYVLRLKERGVVLAVCSKNNQSTAEAVFQRHPEMLLKRDDIAVFVANWDDKATNLRRIAETLNLGVDALVFFDDNPAERAIVRQHLPSVAVPEVPEDPAHYARCLADAGYFEAAAFTADDLARARQYHENARREELRQASVGDLDGYLKSLAMVLQVGAFDDADLPRVVQLINKTNQFTLTTKRATEDEIRALRDAPENVCLHLRLRDTFGDNGIIAVVIATPVANDPATYSIATWLMSCRVLGRGVERATLNVLAAAARKRGAAALIGDYLPTPKNDLVREHYAKLGFTKIAEDHAGPGSSRWLLRLDGFAPHPVHIAVEETNP